MQRRRFLSLAALGLAPPAAFGVNYPVVRAGVPLVFPRDHGAHPAFRTEWWYVTGWLRGGDRDLGFQVTFFRNRPGIGEDDRSAFAPRQLLFAHAALADSDAGRLLHEQRAARAGLGLAEAREGDLAVHVDDWSLVRSGEHLSARVPGNGFSLALDLTPSQPLLLQGERGYSRKGLDPAEASYYVSWPQLGVTGQVTRKGKAFEVMGRAWLDHEWSSTGLAPQALGWDWTGLNGTDGSALMAFRMRGRDGRVVWAGGSERTAAGALRIFSPREVSFEPLYRWRSPRTGTDYPISMRVTAGGRAWTLEPLIDDQELDARASTGTVYWEGAVRATQAGRVAGRGYLELTGYDRPLRLG